jgi:hypothetical protein
VFESVGKDYWEGYNPRAKIGGVFGQPVLVATNLIESKRCFPSCSDIVATNFTLFGKKEVIR